MKDILIHLNRPASLNPRLWVAKKLAQKFSAHITGLHIKRPLTYEFYDAAVQPDIVNEFLNREVKAARESRALLMDLGGTMATDVSYLVRTGDLTHELIKHASTYDVVVVEKPVTGQDYEQLVALPVNVVLGGGRPVLIVPERIERDTIGEQVLVAWNGTPQAARSLHDAMPILSTAKSVNVVVFHPPKTLQEDMQSGPLEKHLRRHDVTFDVLDTTAYDHEVGSGIIGFIHKFDTDLVVMGAYGHSRMREYVLGGVSRTMMREVSVPLFLSH